ncbi:MAG: response regulator transcription factor [Myxococcales bacterium]|nr:response regulator transcription factor [Myxococcales bacterium]
MKHAIFLADDHPLLRKGLCELINAQPDMTVVGEAARGDEVLARDLGHVSVLLLDLSLPGVSGLDVLRALHKHNPKLHVVVLTMYSEEQYAAQVLAEGAAAFVSKSAPPDDLLAILRHVLRHGRYLPESLALADVPDKPLHTRLSAREHQVFTLLYQGKTVSDIAVELAVAPSTVSNHLAKIKEKLHARTIGEIVAYAHRAGLVG